MKKVVFLNNPERKLKKEAGLSGRQWKRKQKAERREARALERKPDVRSDA